MTPFRLARLTPEADADRLQQLLERCSDYYELHEGWPTPPDAGRYELTAAPGLEQDDLFVFGLEDDRGEPQAMIQLLRHHPSPGLWWIGLMVVAPERRSSGIGSLLVRHAIETAAGEGASAMRLAVSTRNPRAEAFWTAAGFVAEGAARNAAPARNGYVDVVRILSQPLTPRSNGGGGR